MSFRSGEKRRRRETGLADTTSIKRELPTTRELNDVDDTKTLSVRRHTRRSEIIIEILFGEMWIGLGEKMQWQSIPSVSDQLNKTTIDEIRLEIETIKQRLSVLDNWQQQLEQIIERGKLLRAVKDTHKNETNTDEPDWTCFCILCNQEVSQKSYPRHIDKCFIRFESQVSYGSNVRSNIEGLFCDTYDRTNNLYCKRLKVICPEHSREPKVGADEACGCPMEKNLFEVSDELCSTAKRVCSKHFKWDRKQRAQLDLERLHELMRLEELIEKENRLRTAMQARGSVAGLLLHKTTAH